MHEERQIDAAPRSWITTITVLSLAVASLVYGILVHLEFIPSLMLIRGRTSWPIVVSEAISVYCLAGIMLLLLHGWRATKPARTVSRNLMLGAPMVAGLTASAVAFAKRSSGTGDLAELVRLSPLLSAAVGTSFIAVLAALTNEAIRSRTGRIAKGTGGGNGL